MQVAINSYILQLITFGQQGNTKMVMLHTIPYYILGTIQYCHTSYAFLPELWESWEDRTVPKEGTTSIWHGVSRNDFWKARAMHAPLYWVYLWSYGSHKSQLCYKEQSESLLHLSGEATMNWWLLRVEKFAAWLDSEKAYFTGMRPHVTSTFFYIFLMSSLMSLNR